MQQRTVYRMGEFESPLRARYGRGDELFEMLYYVLIFKHDCDVIAGDDPRTKSR